MGHFVLRWFIEFYGVVRWGDSGRNAAKELTYVPRRRLPVSFNLR